MADNKEPTFGAGVTTTSVEAVMGTDVAMTSTLNPDGSTTVRSDNRTSPQTVEVGGQTQEQQQQAPAEGEQQQEQTTKQDTGSGDESRSELPNFDAANTEVVAAYDKQFAKADGGINLEALSDQWWANVKEGKLEETSLTDGTYQWLEHKFGLSKDEVKQIEAGQVADRRREQSNLAKVAGGGERLQQAIEWARGGGYTEAQRDAFNRVAFGGRDPERAGEAVELLMSRFDKASKSGTTPKNLASRNAGGGAANGQGGPDVFHNKGEWEAAVKEAGKDPTKRQAVSAKYRRSPGATKWGVAGTR